MDLSTKYSVLVLVLEAVQNKVLVLVLVLVLEAKVLASTFQVLQVLIVSRCRLMQFINNYCILSTRYMYVMTNITSLIKWQFGFNRLSSNLTAANG